MTNTLVRLYVRIWRALVYRKWRARYLARMDRRRTRPRRISIDAAMAILARRDDLMRPAANPYLNAYAQSLMQSSAMANSQSFRSSNQAVGSLTSLLGLQPRP